MMSETSHDLRDYLFDELNAAERAEVEAHLSASPEARDELDRLRVTQQALLSVPDEEIPRRIGFVSDKVFEPSRARRWWLGFWNAAPQFAFGMAAVLVVLFAGVWTVQPTVTANADGWHLAFGEVAAPQPTPAPALAAFDEEQIEVLMRRIAAEQGELQSAELKTVFEEYVQKEATAREAQYEDLRQRSAEAYAIFRSEQEKLRREVGGFNLASLVRSSER